MRRERILGIAVAIIAASMLNTLGQENAPFTQRMPNRAAWRVDVDPKYFTNVPPAPPAEAPAPPPGFPKSETGPVVVAPSPALLSVEVEKSGTVYHEVHKYSDGSKKERWIVKGFQVMENSLQSNMLIRISPNPMAADYSDYTTTDFSDFTWVKKENLAGEGMYGEIPANIHTIQISDVIDLRPDLKQSLAMNSSGIGEKHAAAPLRTMKAYISRESGRPLALEVEGNFKKWSVMAAPAADLILPSQFAAEFRAWNERSTRYKKAPSP